jgi:hypothetical protein
MLASNPRSRMVREAAIIHDETEIAAVDAVLTSMADTKALVIDVRPNGVSAVVPTWQVLRPDGTCLEGEGIAPDVLVAVDPAGLGEKDPILEKALEVLRGKIAK